MLPKQLGEREPPIQDGILHIGRSNEALVPTESKAIITILVATNFRVG
jgi:hypothetical protein